MKVAEELEKIYGTIKGYEPDPPEGKFSRWFSFGKRPNMDPPKGLYIYGSVGGGKTMLMDMFFDCCEVSL
jgi:predicted ATPase